MRAVGVRARWADRPSSVATRSGLSGRISASPAARPAEVEPVKPDRAGVRGLAVAVALIALVAAVVGATLTARSQPDVSASPPPRLAECSFPALRGKLPAAVYLPPGFSSHGRRYPVVYFLHGLPAGPNSYTTNAFMARALVTPGLRAIVVAPQGAPAGKSDREYLDGGRTSTGREPSPTTFRSASTGAIGRSRPGGAAR